MLVCIKVFFYNTESALAIFEDSSDAVFFLVYHSCAFCILTAFISFTLYNKRKCYVIIH